MYLYIKALHIIFIVTWFAGMFYMPRLFIYNTEAQEKPEAERAVLQAQFRIMMKRLWYGITWPSAVITAILGPSLWWQLGVTPAWLWVKLCFIVALYAYFFSLQYIYTLQMKSVFRFSSLQLRVWNEVATLFLFAVVMLAVVKQQMSVVWGLAGLVCLMVVLFTAIRIYKMIRK